MVPFYTYIFICNWIMITFIDISYIKYHTSVMVIYHIPNLMSIHVHVIIVYFVHVDMYSDDDFSLKNNCLSNISNINLMNG